MATRSCKLHLEPCRVKSPVPGAQVLAIGAALVLIIAASCSLKSGPQVPSSGYPPAPGLPEGSGVSSKQAITISAAMSLKSALEELSSLYRAEHPGLMINLNLGASGTLQRQVAWGAPADLFISAAVTQVEELAAQGLIVEDSRVDLLGNELVLITPVDSQSVQEFQDLTSPAVARIAIGQPETVPAGLYARESLANLEIWEALKPKVVPAKDVRQVLAYVATGNVNAGFVYRSDTLQLKNVRVVLAVPPELHDPIVYSAVLLTGSRNRNSAQAFLDYLSTPEAGSVFFRHGFRPLKGRWVSP